jgi:hypothetical protein
MKKFGEPCVECIGFTICAPDCACNSQPCNFFRKAIEALTKAPNSQSDAIAALNRELIDAINDKCWSAVIDINDRMRQLTHV